MPPEGVGIHPVFTSSRKLFFFDGIEVASFNHLATYYYGILKVKTLPGKIRYEQVFSECKISFFVACIGAYSSVNKRFYGFYNLFLASGSYQRSCAIERGNACRRFFAPIILLAPSL